MSLAERLYLLSLVLAWGVALAAAGALIPALVAPWSRSLASAHVRNALGISRVPYGLLVDAQGIVRMKGVVSDRAQLESLIRRRGRHIGRLEWEPAPARDP